MAEVVLAAEIGRPTGSRAVRRLRREGKIPGVIYGHGTEALPVAVVAGTSESPLTATPGPTSCSRSTPPRAPTSPWLVRCSGTPSPRR